ncbi:hypothetical protein R69888_02982 [Paraburkholderia haematera]|uniref:Uncharacterized protein n=1 Tax=Paraburkholderia haematera TaxID=2793077 RepID=A0ABN7LHT2_9BURK|nr:hypothetical protein R69888_02982 [Paraburkholderia haematera]
MSWPKSAQAAVLQPVSGEGSWQSMSINFKMSEVAEHLRLRCCDTGGPDVTLLLGTALGVRF